jgi:hypothetical protein
MPETELPFGHTVFCDDIRAEINGKLSIVGMYSGVMGIEGDLPASIPKFGFLVTFFEPLTLALKRRFPVRILIYLPGEVDEGPAFVNEIPFPDDDTLSLMHSMQSQESEATPLIRHVLNLVVAPLRISETGSIKSRADYDGNIIKLGTTRVVRQDEMQSAILGNQI